MVVQTRKVKNPTIASTEIAWNCYMRKVNMLYQNQQTNGYARIPDTYKQWKWKDHITNGLSEPETRINHAQEEYKWIFKHLQTNRENGLSGTWTWTTSNDLCHSFIFTSRRLRICRQLRHLRIDAPGASTKVWGFRGFGSLSFKSMRTWLWKWHHHTTRLFLASLIRMPVITLLMKSNYPAMSQGLED